MLQDLGLRVWDLGWRDGDPQIVGLMSRLAGGVPSSGTEHGVKYLSRKFLPAAPKPQTLNPKS